MKIQRLPNRFKVSFQNFRKFNWRERIQILFGYNAIIDTAVLVDKRDGRTWQNTRLATTKEVEPEKIIQ